MRRREDLLACVYGKQLSPTGQRERRECLSFEVLLDIRDLLQTLNREVAEVLKPPEWKRKYMITLEETGEKPV